MPPSQDPLYAGLGQAVRIGTELLAALIVGGGIGWVVDTYLFGSIPGDWSWGWAWERLRVCAMPIGRRNAGKVEGITDRKRIIVEESPLHAFELYDLIPLAPAGIDISVNKAVILMWVIVGLVAFLMISAAASRKLVPGKLQNLAELIVEFIRGIILDTMGEAGMKYFPLVATLFLFILFANLLGLIPGSYTVTSQIIVTAVFALGIYGLSIVLGFSLHGAKFLGILVPPGTPGWLLPLMIPIELISQLARPISLAVRLFANMTAGHVILGVLFGLAISGGLLIGWLPFAFTIAMNGLEVGIAFIQAYIFTVLSCVYLGDAVTLHGHSEHAH